MALIETGDLIAVPRAHGVIGLLTQFFTRSQYTHVGVARWIGNELFVAELNGGRNHYAPILQMPDYDVYAAPEGLRDVDGAIQQWVDVRIGYGYLAFIVIGLIDWIRARVFIHWRRILVCSGFCVAIYESAGWPEHTRILSPGDLTALLRFKFSVRNHLPTIKPASAGSFLP